MLAPGTLAIVTLLLVTTPAWSAEWLVVGSAGSEGNCMSEFALELGDSECNQPPCIPSLGNSSGAYVKRRCRGGINKNDPCTQNADCPGSFCVTDSDVGGSASTTQFCEDGDPSCDQDGEVNGCCKVQLRYCFCVQDPTQSSKNEAIGESCTNRRARECVANHPDRYGYDSYYAITEPRHKDAAYYADRPQIVHKRDTLDWMRASFERGLGVSLAPDADPMRASVYKLMTPDSGRTETSTLPCLCHGMGGTDVESPECMDPSGQLIENMDPTLCEFPKMDQPQTAESCSQAGFAYVPVKGKTAPFQWGRVKMRGEWINPSRKKKAGFPNPCHPISNVPLIEDDPPCENANDIDIGSEILDIRCYPKAGTCSNNAAQPCYKDIECGLDGTATCIPHPDYTGVTNPALSCTSLRCSVSGEVCESSSDCPEAGESCS